MNNRHRILWMVLKAIWRMKTKQLIEVTGLFVAWGCTSSAKWQNRTQSTMLKTRRQAIQGRSFRREILSRVWQSQRGKTIIIREDTMRTFWENESVPYAFENDSLSIFMLLATGEEEVTSGDRRARIRSQARPISEDEANSLRALMPIRK